MKKLILFDIDGTLLLSGGVGGIAFEKTFLEFFEVRNVWQDIKPHGRTDPSLMQEIAERSLGRVLTEEELSTLSERYAQNFADTLQSASNFRVLPGVSELLDLLLRAPNVVCGIQTGNFRSTGEMKLRHAKLQQHFTFGGFACDSALRTEIISSALERGRAQLRSEGIPKESAVWVIGDSVQDIQSGIANGAKTIGVATGAVSTDDLREAGADHAFEKLTDTQMIKELLVS